ncbi:type-F conjugative transfer system pilin assembly protein TraF [Glaesserella parasuis]|uniref:type-F conjugative transfer system pilin assembly protein TraF n=1 Tax=Glaesserella parasuis TaxID=738 RepID=UPI00094FBE76|nr:type-F conjugative transfer system pilin assembly protein TraF [Glaesserella parasuis]MCT8760477.1 type-F conjugative transfer system pilin assembly protein TraF [Glaesserella parasuis]MCT8766585.1 type-F conjugative transfer system pilin assembly protein TraF [Glaesserella parasuis]MDG6261616.1 type-F conjugative transfer system pilin assembly protein TraF [Glaesserella parasuis]MDG6280380.1 type-F conjugative transfer system pilin assembly protein TraF [Glaesserella parasuis]MDG6307838.1 
MKKVIAVLGCFVCVSARTEQGSTSYNPATGWQFYNLPEKKKEIRKQIQPKVETPSFNKLPPIKQIEVLQQKLQEAKANAIMNPTADNVATYKVFQDYFVEKSSQFASAWEEALLKFPQLDYNIKNSIYNATAPIKAAQERAEQNQAIQVVNQNYGIFFFYRGNEPIDNKLAEVVKDFSKQYSLSIVPISIDGRVNPEFPNSKKDSGQAMAMGIKYFPAIFLVNPKKQEYKPLSYGFITQDDLARRVLNVVTNFKPRI